jgi:hypothetical protein
MRARRFFQPSLDGMPNRIAPSGVALHAVIASHSSVGIQADDNTDPSSTPSSAGATQNIIQPVTVPTTLLA